MFDDDPGEGWAVLSNSGGPYYQKFLRPGATANFSGGLGNASHTSTYVVNSGAASANGAQTLSLGAGQLAAAGHIHGTTKPYKQLAIYRHILMSSLLKK